MILRLPLPENIAACWFVCLFSTSSAVTEDCSSCVLTGSLGPVWLWCGGDQWENCVSYSAEEMNVLISV